MKFQNNLCGLTNYSQRFTSVLLALNALEINEFPRRLCLNSPMYFWCLWWLPSEPDGIYSWRVLLSSGLVLIEFFHSGSSLMWTAQLCFDMEQLLLIMDVSEHEAGIMPIATANAAIAGSKLEINLPIQHVIRVYLGVIKMWFRKDQLSDWHRETNGHIIY